MILLRKSRGKILLRQVKSIHTREKVVETNQVLAQRILNFKRHRAKSIGLVRKNVSKAIPSHHYKTDDPFGSVLILSRRLQLRERLLRSKFHTEINFYLRIQKKRLR